MLIANATAAGRNLANSIASTPRLSDLLIGPPRLGHDHQALAETSRFENSDDWPAGNSGPLCGRSAQSRARRIPGLASGRVGRGQDRYVPPPSIDTHHETEQLVNKLDRRAQAPEGLPHAVSLPDAQPCFLDDRRELVARVVIDVLLRPQIAPAPAVDSRGDRIEVGDFDQQPPPDAGHHAVAKEVDRRVHVLEYVMQGDDVESLTARQVFAARQHGGVGPPCGFLASELCRLDTGD